ncbi:hypothetical protein [Rickettsiella endosymbiont of Miltochrista miniata]|uniref:hypothetical protein n=1 Tax=Rickettsiella endosymbiont of Miltochrista miniata TaxID=3066239 RepID=UPI00313AC4E6
MSNFLSPNLVKAVTGDYRISIKSIFSETGQQLLKMPKAFWQGFGLIILILVGTIGLLTRLYDFVMWFGHLTKVPIPTSIAMFGIAILEIFRFLFTASLAFLALHHIRNQPTKVMMIFTFFKNWRSLLFISVLFYLLSRAVHYGLLFVFRAIHLYPLLPQDLSRPIFALGYGAHIFLAILLYTYLTVVAFMASLLVLDQQLTLKNSLACAFKSINQHLVKNLILMFLASVVYAAIWIDLANLFFSIEFAYYKKLGFFALGALAPILIIGYKKITLTYSRSIVKNFALASLLVILGLVIAILFYAGVGLTWLLPVIALLIAIQYQHIFLDKSLSYV